MKKFTLQVVGLIVLLIVSGVLLFNSSNYNFSGIAGTNRQPAQFFSQTQSGNLSLKVGNATINTEVADTEEKRTKGLSGRDSLGPGSGMLFTFDKPDKYSFWMKDMKFPLDFIWIKDDQVVDLLKNIQPPVPNQADNTLVIYQPVVPINKVLEVNGGFVDKNNIKVGDKVLVVNSQ